MTRPARSYLICANQRSGTTMLCRVLAATGVAGRPEEYFLAVDEATQPGWQCWEDGPFGVANGATDRASYLEIVHRLGTTPNGIFGAKLMWNNVRWAVAKFQEVPSFSGLDRAGVFRAAFSQLQVIHLTRRDRLRQAVSWARAAQDGVWLVADDETAGWSASTERSFEPPPVPTFDAELIGNLEALIIEGERGWKDLFAELDLLPHEVVYEDLVSEAGYEPTTRGILDFLHVGDQVADTPRPTTRRQSDALNEEWVERYRAERGDG